MRGYHHPSASYRYQLHRQGVGRFFGLLTTASNLGIIGKKKLTPVPRRQATAAAKAAGAARQEYRLGNGLTEYEVLDPSESKCDKFLEATRAEEPGLATPSDAGASTPCALDDLVDYGTRRAAAARQRIGTKSGALPFSAQDVPCADVATVACISRTVRLVSWDRSAHQRQNGVSAANETSHDVSASGASAMCAPNSSSRSNRSHANILVGGSHTPDPRCAKPREPFLGGAAFGQLQGIMLRGDAFSARGG